MRSKICDRLRDLVIFEVFGMKLSGKKSIFQNCRPKIFEHTVDVVDELNEL